MANPNRTPPLTLLDKAALFLDFDGTLVELADAPGAIVVSPELGPLLRRLNDRLEGRLAIVTGRSIDDLERHLDWSGAAVAGSHGLELRFADGMHVPLAVPPSIDEAVGRVRELVGSTPGVLIEEKPAGVAVHYRQAPDQEAQLDNFMELLAASTGLAVQRGKMVIELRAAGADKGGAVRLFMSRPPFAGAQPLFIGDDLTDEHAFAAAVDLGGTGILVGPPRQTAAEWRLDDVDDVAKWLRRSVEGQ
jgi:trehalose 6-phosphate phosphatase